MKTTIKIFVSGPSVKNQKFAFTLQEGVAFLIDKNSPGLPFKEAQALHCQFLLKNGGLWITNPEHSEEIQYNDVTLESRYFTKGDLIQFGAYIIEFAEAPGIPVETEARTQFIEIGTPYSAHATQKQSPQVDYLAVFHKTWNQILNFIPWTNIWHTAKNSVGVVAIVALVTAIALGASLRHAKQELLQSNASLLKLEKKLADQEKTAQQTLMAQKQALELIKQESLKKQQEISLAKITHADPKIAEALVKAASNGKVALLKDFIAHKHLSADTQNKEGTPALVAAAKAGKLDAVKFLVTHKANVNIKDKKGMTALMWSAAKKSKTVTAYLLEQGANSKLKNKDGKIAYDFAKGSKEIAKLLGGKNTDRKIASVTAKKQSKKKK